MRHLVYVGQFCKVFAHNNVSFVCKNIYLSVQKKNTQCLKFDTHSLTWYNCIINNYQGMLHYFNKASSHFNDYLK